MKGFYEALAALEEEKGIPKEYMLEKIKAAIAATIRRDKNVPQELVEVEFNEAKDKVRVYIKKDIIEQVLNPSSEITLEEARKISKKYKVGDVAQIDVDPSDVGRIAAKVGKNVIIQAINEAVNGTIINEFEDKKGSVVSGTVRSSEGPGRTVMIEIGNREMPLFAREQIPGETFSEGDIVKVCVNMQEPDAHRGIRTREVLLTRVSPGFVEKLFELEVPEIAQGVVQVKGVSREAGSRSKVAVSSTDANVDAVGACIGTHRSRISSILQNLSGERIDLIKYSEDAGEYVAAALSPAEVKLLEIDTDAKTCKVLVPADQLSLAIGKTGQNVRLAARLTGYKIDIISE